MKSFSPQETITTLNTILEIEQHVSGMDYLRSLVKNIALTFEAKYVLVGRATPSENDSIQTDVFWGDNDYLDNFTYKLKNTPCENVVSGNRVCVYPEGVANKFSKDKLLVQMEVDSYVGSPILTREGKLSGIIVLLDSKPVQDVGFFTAIIEFLAARIAAEFEKYYIKEELKRQVVEKTCELEKTNQELTTALAEIKTLRGIIPICSNCKKIRDDQGFWQQVESYVTEHTEVAFTHSICPDCIKDFYNELDLLKKNK